MQAGAGLLRRLLALGVSLVVEHEGVPALFAEILREGVARPHRLQARILLDARLRDDRARVGLRRACAARLRSRRSACAADPPCGGSRRIAAGNSCPRSRGPRVSSVSSTTRKNGFRASCLCWKIETRTIMPMTAPTPARQTRTPKTTSGRAAVKVQQAIFEGEVAHRRSIWDGRRSRGSGCRTWSRRAPWLVSMSWTMS